MIIQEAAEMYLETIYGLSLDLEHVRSIDVAKKMGYSKPTVSIMIRISEKTATSKWMKKATSP